jgi:hypothetical protein
MLSIPGSLRIFIATSPVDCRKSHDGLAALVFRFNGSGTKVG